MSATPEQEPSDGSTNVGEDSTQPIHDRNNSVAEEPKEPRPGLLKRAVAKINLDLPTFLLMLKGGVPPAIALASYQSDGWAKQYSTLGYLVAIISTLSMPILPRAKYVQGLTNSLIAICLAAAMGLLAIQCAVAARQHGHTHSASTTTGSSGSTQSTDYSAAASVTACVWLFFNLYMTNTIRALRPQLFPTSIQYNIFTVVLSTYAPTFPNMTAGMDFVQRLLKVFLTGYALAAGVSLFLIPISSRMISYKQMAGIMNLMKDCLSIHAAYLHGITRHEEMIGRVDENGTPVPIWDNPEATVSMQQAEDAAKKLKMKLQQMSQLFSRLKIEISFAKREVGWGKLQAGDFTKIWNLLQDIRLPLSGLSTFIDILQSIKHHKAAGEDVISDMETVEAIRRMEADEWTEIIIMSRGPFHKVRLGLADGLAHIGYVLELVPRPKAANKDLEKAADASPAPGDPKFADYLETEIKLFEQHRQDTLREWCEKKGIDVPSTFWEDPSVQYNFKDSDSVDGTVRHKENHQQLYLILYLQYLLHSVCLTILDMVRFADSKVQDGTMKKNKLILPGWRRIRKLMQSSFMQADSTQESPDGETNGIIVALGASLMSGRKDPEHLPPTTWYERASDHLRLIPKFFASPQSAFGFRAAVGSISLAIIGYIRQTSHFFLAQRGIWAVIMVAISMGPTAGVGVQGFIGRILGTAISTGAALTIWYMSDEKTGAIIPLAYIYFVFCFYFVLKKPKYIIAAVISVVTVILIIGYELQDRKVGTQVLETSGQAFYNIYLLAPYRLASVVAGISVAFIWTYFPYPITTHATLRKDLGVALYMMANFHSLTHSTVETKLRHGSLPRGNDKSCPMRRLDKARHKLYEKIMVMMNRLREHSAFTVYEPIFGGKFPKQTYDELIAHMQRLINYMALMSWSSQAFNSSPDGQESEWLRDFRRATVESRITSHELTSTLYLLSASITNIQPLPPYIRVPVPIDIADQLSAIDPGILSTKHIDEPCYAAFAVLEIASILVMEEVSHVLAKIKDLVGEVDFSVHLIGTGASSADNSYVKLNKPRKGKAE
ncbi:hypothetical protein A1O1_09040 [Capronia coronata CBS 617.96]|uniref:ER transporter 6TM N-terminal domain-containing protein n=1 Tax=Capronia coronata CBS 617.96 TaxID=1182541 RepID=W9Y8A3_9EURO|nr:uncharacterized protein A1O1_09040 [Capronia coronata CBS 617.96]EXJ78639.1 hypothetical protein A1O1_09040 [Capronia coronata CBS 617.96]